MTTTISRLQVLLAPAWQEVRSLWSGADFAFLDPYFTADEAGPAPLDLPLRREPFVQPEGCCC